MALIACALGAEHSTFEMHKLEISIDKGVPGVTNGKDATAKTITRQGHYFSDANMTSALSTEAAAAVSIQKRTEPTSPINCIVMMNALYKAERFAELREVLGISDLKNDGVFSSDETLKKIADQQRTFIGFKPILAIETTDKSGIMFIYESISESRHMIQSDYLKKMGALYIPSLPPHLHDNHNNECFDIFNTLVYEQMFGKKALHIK